MKVFFPLSLKVSLWLLLNLAVLGTVGVAFLVNESGFGWDALISGPAGNRLQAVADVIATELRENPGRPRDEVLTPFSKAYSVDFALFLNNGRQLAGPQLPLPPIVLARLNEVRNNPGPRGGGGPGGGNPFGQSPVQIGPGNPLGQPNTGGSPNGGRGGRGGGFEQPQPTLNDNNPRNPAPTRGDPFATAGVATPRPAAQTLPTVPVVTARPSRFLVRSQDPVGYWAGVRLPLLPSGGGQQSVTLIMHASSLGEAALLLDLKPWLVVGTVALLLSVLFWLPLVRGVTRSLGQLTRATEQIAEGRFDTRVDESRRDELGRLGGAVNLMAAQLDRAATGQKRFLGDIAHELGSPVGRLQVAVSILEEQAAPALQPAVADVREEVQQMSGLVNELLTFTKAGLKPRDAALAHVPLAALAAEVLAHEAAEKKVFVTVPTDIAVQADAALLSRALANLVRNALRYAGDAGPVALTATVEGREIVIAVEDNGPGVPPDTLARLGEPFYRPEFARTRETGGAGLGLAIVKSAVEACRGTVRFSNRDPHGFRAEVRLAAA